MQANLCMAHFNCARRPHRLAQRSDGLIYGLPLHPQRTSTTLTWRILPCAASLTARQQQRSHGVGRAVLNSRGAGNSYDLIRLHAIGPLNARVHIRGVTAGNSRARRAEAASKTRTNHFAATRDPSLPKRDRRLGVSGGLRRQRPLRHSPCFAGLAAV